MGSPEEMLLYVIDQENDNAVEVLINTGINLNYRTAEGYTPLLCATEKGNYKIVKILVDHGADCNFIGKLQNDHGEPSVVEWTPLFNAVLYGHSDIVEFLIEHGADVNFRDKHWRSALSTAMQQGHEECAKILIKHGAQLIPGDENTAFFEINLKELFKDKGTKEREEEMPKNHSLPLHNAVLDENREIISELINKSVNLNMQDKKGNTALHLAMEKSNVSCVELLIKRGVNLNIPDGNGNTVLHMASSLGIASIIPQLIENGAIVDCKNKDDLTPLLFAIFHSRPLCAKQLLNYGAKVNETFDGGKTALHIAVTKSQDCVKMLLKENADVFAKDNKGICPVELAIHQGVRCFKKLFPGKCNVANDIGETPLHYAAQSGKNDTLEYILKGECNVNVQTKNGDTPLHFACIFDEVAYAAKSLLCEGMRLRETPSNVQLLLEAGADIKKKNKYGQAPVHICAHKGRLHALQILKEHGADINLCGGRRKRTPLHIACEEGHLKICKFLLKNGAEKNAIDADRCTPLMLTAKNGNFQCVGLLLENDALLWAN